ncbi:hypothetical protein ACWELJ_23475 [Nocardia sp. NPDC004582]
MIAAPPAVRRAGIARLVVVLAALLAIMAIQNGHCAIGSAMPMVMAAPDMAATTNAVVPVSADSTSMMTRCCSM